MYRRSVSVLSINCRNMRHGMTNSVLASSSTFSTIAKVQDPSGSCRLLLGRTLPQRGKLNQIPWPDSIFREDSQIQQYILP